MKDEMNSIIRLWLNHAITWSVWFSWNIKNDSFPNTSYQPVSPIKIKHLVTNQNFNEVPGTCTRFKNEAEFSTLRYLCVIPEANFRGICSILFSQEWDKARILYSYLRFTIQNETSSKEYYYSSWTYPRTGLARQYFPGQPQMMLYNTNEVS